jgi:predicted GIY-YIG superfamily endonuclease
MARDIPGTVYLLHFDEPISPRHTCQHYCGWAADLEARIEDHRHGRGARLTEVAHSRGIGFTVSGSPWPAPGPARGAWSGS